MSFFDEPTYEPPQNGIAPVEPLDVATSPSSAVAVSLDLPALSRFAREIGPRNLPEILSRAREIGTALGSVLDPSPRSEGTAAYYRWQVRNSDGSTSTVEGPTIDLMDALAGEWGRLTYQIEILREQGPRVWLRARVVDLVTLVIHERPYVAHLKPPPGKFANKPDEAERWRVMQLQSAESKAIRGVLERVIPQHVQLEAIAAAREAASATQLGTVQVTDRDGRPVLKDGRPVMRRRTLAEAVAEAVRGLGSLEPPVPLELVERWVGRPRTQWIASDLGSLRTLYRRWKAGEVTRELLEAEVGALEAGRPPSEAVVREEPAADRLAGLGLGSPPAASTPDAVGSAGVAAGGGSHRAAPAPTPDRRAELLAELDGYRRTHPALVAAHAAPVGVINGRTALGKIEQVVTAIRTAIGTEREAVLARARPAPAELPPEPEPEQWTGPVGSDLVGEVRALSAELGPEVAAAALAAAGIPAIDGAPEAGLRRLLTALLEHLPE